MNRHESALLVFMSATVDRIKEYILNDIGYEEPDPEIIEDSEQAQMRRWAERNTKEVDFPEHIPYGELYVREYGAEADYSHVDIHILEGIDSIPDIVKEKKENGWYS